MKSTDYSEVFWLTMEVRSLVMNYCEIDVGVQVMQAFVGKQSMRLKVFREVSTPPADLCSDRVRSNR
jgi:hypothetical protein